MLPSACGLGQHFQDLGHSFSLYGPPSRPITYIYFQCKSLGLPKCKRMTEAMINNAKKCLKNLTKCDEIYTSEDPMGDFGKATLNYYQHYTDDHSSTWCRFDKKVLIKQCLDHFPYIIVKPLSAISVDQMMVQFRKFCKFKTILCIKSFIR